MNRLKPLFSLFYPDICICCWANNAVKDGHFCMYCLAELPFTPHFRLAENSVTKKFWGRVEIESGASLFYYSMDSVIREMIHKMKYNNKPFIAEELGKIAGKKMVDSGLFDEVTHIIAVPMHYRKQIKRGYNQSEVFGKGIASVIKKPLVKDLLIKYKPTTTQTDKGRLNRFENVIDSFQLKGAHRYVNSHFLIIDDVITTGATIDACVEKLRTIKGAKFSVLTMVMAKI